MAAANSDMRLVIAGAGGRMGRTLIHAVAATKGLALAGAVEAAGSAAIGRDAGELAGLGPNGVKVVSDVAPLLKAADGLIEFTIPAATLAFAELTAAAGLVHVIGTTGHSAAEEAVIAKTATHAPTISAAIAACRLNHCTRSRIWTVRKLIGLLSAQSRAVTRERLQYRAGRP